MVKLWLIIAIFISLLVPSVFAVSSEEIQFFIEDDSLFAHHTIESNESVRIITPSDAFNFEVLVDSATAQFELQRTDRYKQVIVPLKEGQHIVEITYRSSAFLEKGSHSYVVGEVVTSSDTDHLLVKLQLPEGALLARPVASINPPASPRPDSVESTGRSIILTWQREQVAAGTSMPFFVVYDPQQGELTFILIIIAVGIAVYAIIVGRNYVKKKKDKEVISAVTRNRFPHLLESEQSIVDALSKAKDNTLWQKELEIATGFTKSKLSRTVRHLEQRGLVKKIPYGNSNKIQLIDEQQENEHSTKEEPATTDEYLQ